LGKRDLPTNTTAQGSRKKGDWLRGANHCGTSRNVVATVPVPFFPQPARRWSVAKGDRHRRRRPYWQRQRDEGDGASPHLRLPPLCCSIRIGRRITSCYSF